MKKTNLHEYPYHSRRTAVCASNGMVATSQPLAAQAGLDVLRSGGNAVDAAVAAAACLTVVEPTSNGIGSDAFAIVWYKGRLYGLNASGPSPKAISVDEVKAGGHQEMPRFGWVPVTVPGAPAAWAELSKSFGVLPLQRVMKPAADYAREGFPVSPDTASSWRRAWQTYRRECTGREFAPWFETFAPGGAPPEAGELWRSAGHARTLEELAESSCESFYRGRLAEETARFSRRCGGFLREDDLASFNPIWTEPVGISHRGYTVWELPPNTQGIITLMALRMLQGFDLSGMSIPERRHLQIEAMKLAFSDGLAYITDPSAMEISLDQLLSEQYARKRGSEITDTAMMPEAGSPGPGGTVYLAAADREGTMVSFIQSNYMGFGSGIVVPGTGIALQNRGHTFSLDPAHANVLKPAKRSYHTIIPGFITRGNEAVGPFGVMGGFMQPQGHLQVVMHLLDDGLNPQAALDAPRWQWVTERQILLEPSVPEAVVRDLRSRGHDITVSGQTELFGRGQIILRDPETGVLTGGTEPRTDGTAAAW